MRRLRLNIDGKPNARLGKVAADIDYHNGILGAFMMAWLHVYRSVLDIWPTRGDSETCQSGRDVQRRMRAKLPRPIRAWADNYLSANSSVASEYRFNV